MFGPESGTPKIGATVLANTSGSIRAKREHTQVDR